MTTGGKYSNGRHKMCKW